MNKQYVRILSLSLCLFLLAGIFAGCGEKTKRETAGNTYQTNYSFSTLEQSPDIQIDGVLDEAAWQGKTWWSNTYANNQGAFPYYKFTAFPTEYGVYVAYVTDDHNLRTDGQRDPNSNSNFEMYFAACNADEDFYERAYANDMASRKIHVDMRGEIAGLYGNVERAVKVEGELNSGETNGATLEMLVSWETLDVDITKGLPETVAILPCYRGVLAAGGVTSFTASPGGNLYNPATFYVFDSNGYINADKDGAVLGDAVNGISKSAGWDLSQEANGVVRSTQMSQCFLFFKEMQGENFVVETTMIPVKEVQDDWPKAGVCFQQTDGLYFSVMLDPMGKNGVVDSINGTKNFPNYQLGTLDMHDGNWNQYSLSGYDMVNPNAAKQEGVKLTVIKYGNRFWYFADGKYMTSQTVDWISGDCFPGLFSLGYEVIYRDYSCKAIDIDDLRTYLNEASMYIVEAKVNGKGGNVTASSMTVSNGGSYDLSFTSKSGYRLSSVIINGTEMIDAVRENAKAGSYTVTGITGNQEITVAYEEMEGVTYHGIITDGTQNIRADMILINLNDGSIRYEDRSGSKGFEFVIPAGTYEVRVRTDENQWQSKIVEITADTEDEIAYTVNSEEVQE